MGAASVDEPMALAAPYFDFYFNEHRTDLSHLVPSISGFDAGEDVATVCGLVTSVADHFPDFELCPTCVAGAE